MSNGGGRGWPKDEQGRAVPPPDAQAFGLWLLTPASERGDVDTEKKWAAANDVPEGTVKGWKRNPNWKPWLARKAEEMNLSTERIQRVINAMFKEAEMGNVKAAQLVLQFAERLQPKRIVIEDRTLAGMSDNELRDQLARAGMLVDVERDD